MIAIKFEILLYVLFKYFDESDDNELIWVLVWMVKLKELYLCVYYKFFNVSLFRFDYFLNIIFKVFDKNKNFCFNIVIVGDFNCGDIFWNIDFFLIINNLIVFLMNCLFDFFNINV